MIAWAPPERGHTCVPFFVIRTATPSPPAESALRTRDRMLTEPVVGAAHVCATHCDELAGGRDSNVLTFAAAVPHHPEREPDQVHV